VIFIIKKSQTYDRVLGDLEIGNGDPDLTEFGVAITPNQHELAQTLHQDYIAEGVPDQDMGDRAESGAVGFGLLGTLLAQASRPLASTIAFTGAGFSVYSTFIARGKDVVLPMNTPVKVSIGTHGNAASGGQPARRGLH
jgi:hypothetical protein